MAVEHRDFQNIVVKIRFDESRWRVELNDSFRRNRLIHELHNPNLRHWTRAQEF